MDNTIDTLQIEVESSTTDAQRGLTKLKNSLQKLNEMSNAVANMNSDGISKLKEMAQGVESLANAGSNPGLSAAVSKLRKLSKIDFSNLGTGSEKISEIADKVGEITNANPTSTITPPETFTETVHIAPSVDVEETKSKLSQLKEFAANIFSSIKTRSTTVFGGVAKVISGAFKGTVTVFQKLGSAAKSVFGAMKKLGSYIGGKIKGAVGGATKKFSGFIRSMGRVAVYRAIRFVLSQIATAFKEGTNNVYQYSKAIGGNLASSMDRIASSFLYFKNSIGAMVAPLINALAPAIEYVIDKAVALINVLNQLFAKLSGASTWTKAVKTQTEYAEAAGDAADAAKSLTAGFDELNVLSDSGSGKGSDMDYGSMFEEVQLDNDFANWIDQVKESISNGDWASVGEILGGKVDELVGKVDFASIGDKLGDGIQSAFETIYNFLDAINFDKVGSGIATALNHMMDKIDFGLVGKTFAKKWTILVDTLYGFVTTFDWTKFGLAIADFINGWFEEVDLTKTVQMVQELALGIFESLSQAIRNVEWYKIGTQIMDALESIDWMALLGDLGTLLSDAVVALLDLLLAVVGETDWGKVVQDICAGIGNMLANIEWGEILAKIGMLVVELVVQLPGIIVGALGGIADILGGLFEGFGLDSVAGFFYGIGDAMRSAGSWLKKHLVDPVVNWVKKLFGIHSPSTVFAEIGTYLIDGLLQGIEDTWRNIVKFFSEKLDGIKKVCSDAWDAIKTATSTVWGNIKSFLSTTWDTVKSTANTVWNAMKTTMQTTWGAVKSNTSTAWSTIKTSLSETWTNIKTLAGTTWDSLKSTITTVWTNISTDTSTKWNNMKTMLSTTWNSVKSTASSVFDSIKTSIANVWGNVKTNTTTVWGGLKTTLSTTWGNIKSTAASVFSSMKSTICSVWDGLESHISRTVDSITDFVDNMRSIVSSGVGVVRDLFDSAVSAARSAISRVSDALSSIGSSVSNAVSSASAWVGDRLGFASGGFPEVGQLFIAREAGAEMVGSIGGRTAVANNDQIVEGIYQGVLAAMRASDNSNGGNFDVRVYLDGKQITAAVEKRQRERGATIYPGGVLNGI